MLNEIIKKYEDSNPKMDFLLWFTDNYNLIKKYQTEQSILSEVSIELPSIDSIDFHNWLMSEKYKPTLNSYLYLKNNYEYDKDILYKHYCNVLQFGN